MAPTGYIYSCKKHGMMEFEVFTVNPFAENTYLALQGGKALVIDPGFVDDREWAQCRSALAEAGAEPEAIVLTHAHVDHILGLNCVLRDFDLPVYLHLNDRFHWDNFVSQAGMFGLQVDVLEVEPKPLQTGPGIEMGSFTFDVLPTPGHAPEHISLYWPEDGCVIAGDVLFRQSIGRTDLYKGDLELLKKSIREKLYTLPDKTRVLPGHGPETTIEFEKQHNPFVRA